MASFRETFIKYTLVGVFILAIMSFSLQLQLENDSQTSILDYTIINNSFNRLEGNLTDAEEVAQTQKENFETEIPERGFGSLIIFAIVAVGQTFTSGIVSIYNTVIVLPSQVLGIPQAVISAFTSILLVTLVILAWRVYRSGD